MLKQSKNFLNKQSKIFLIKKKTFGMIKNIPKLFSSQKETDFYLFKESDLMPKENEFKKNQMLKLAEDVKIHQDELEFNEIKKYFTIPEEKEEFILKLLKDNFQDFIIFINENFDKLSKEKFKIKLQNYNTQLDDEANSIINNKNISQDLINIKTNLKLFFKKNYSSSELIDLIEFVDFRSNHFLKLFEIEIYNTNIEEKLENLNLDDMKKNFQKQILENRTENEDNNNSLDKNYKISPDENLESFFLKHKIFPDNINHKKNINLDIMNYQEKDEIIMIRQDLKIKKTKWLYLMDLPFNFEYEDMYEKIKINFENYGKINKIFLVKYANFIQKKNELEHLFKNEIDKKDFQNFSTMVNNVSKNNSNSLNLKLDDKIDEDLNIKFQKSYKNIFKLLGKENRKEESYEKSYAFIEFEEQEKKDKILNKSNRVLGIYFNNRSHKIDNADYKTNLKLYNIPYGTKLVELMNLINSNLSINNLKGFILDKNEKNKILTGNSIVLEFSDFETSLKAIVILNNLSFKNRKIKVNHFSSNLYYQNGKLKEIFRINKADEVHLRLKVLRQREIIRNQKRFLKYDNDSLLFDEEKDSEDFDENYYFEKNESDGEN